MKTSRAFINSFPKSGTNLVEKLLRLLGYAQSQRSIAFSSVRGRHELVKRATRSSFLFGDSVSVGIECQASVSARWLRRYIDGVPPNHYMSGHAAWSGHLEYLLRQSDIKVIQVIRDPRGILSSRASYVVEKQNDWHPFHHAFKAMSRRQLLQLYIKGGFVEEVGSYYSGIREALGRIEGWLHSHSVMVVRFEDLVGEKGGGSQATQREALQRIVQFLGIGDADLSVLQDQLFGGTHTFRGGQIDRWVDDFDPELTHAISEELSDLPSLRRLGYSFGDPGAFSRSASRDDVTALS